MMALAGKWLKRSSGDWPLNSPVDVEFLSLGGISLMEHLIGYERAILIDAVTSDQETGSVIVSKLNEMPDHSAFHIASAHDTSLQNALKLGREMGANLPEDVIVVGIATDPVYDFSEIFPIRYEIYSQCDKNCHKFVVKHHGSLEMNVHLTDDFLHL